jgi:hypothetical protein
VAVVSNRAPTIRSLAIGCAVVLALAGTLYTAVRIDPNVLCLVPALGMALMLLAHRYPGERILLRRLGTHRVRRRLQVISRPRVGATVMFPRGGLLLGYALAVRPPPVALAPS